MASAKDAYLLWMAEADMVDSHPDIIENLGFAVIRLGNWRRTLWTKKDRVEKDNDLLVNVQRAYDYILSQYHQFKREYDSFED